MATTFFPRRDMPGFFSKLLSFGADKELKVVDFKRFTLRAE